MVELEATNKRPVDCLASGADYEVRRRLLDNLPEGAGITLSRPAEAHRRDATKSGGHSRVIYEKQVSHVMVHAIPLLWRLHRVHHADLDFDVTTGARFHTLEILLSMGIKFAVILLLGPPLVAVVIFEVLLNATSMFNHSNVRMPLGLDRVLRWFVVTPDMHRVHHSTEDDETNSNFGFNLPWWDRLFGTYRDQPRAGHEAMDIGIRSFREDKWCSWLPGMLTIPFVGKISDYAINRRRWEDGHEA